MNKSILLLSTVVLLSISLAFIAFSCKQEPKAAAAYAPAALEPSAAAPAWADGANIYEVNIRQYTPEGSM